jgi:ribonuclease HI
LKLAWTNFYDDYPTAELQCNAVASDIVIRSFLMLLGWTMTTEAAKCHPFAEAFEVLGAVIDLKECVRNSVSVRNKPGRVEAICNELQSILDAGSCPAPVAAVIRGRCQYASNQMFGRIAAGALHVLAKHQFSNRSKLLSEETRQALVSLSSLVRSSPPRCLKFTGETRPVLIFSDGACEGQDRSQVTVGAVVFDTVSKKSFMFGLEVPDSLVNEWKAEGKIQTIGQAELLPALLARLSFRKLLTHRRAVFFLDNDSARMGLIKGYSPSPASNRIIQAVVADEAPLLCWSWYARVPGPSNPGDGPSRLRLVPHPENLYSSVCIACAVPNSVYAPVR